LKGVFELNTENYVNIIESFIYDYPVCEFYYLKPSDLIFSDKVRYICEKDCPHYGKSWACPPAIRPIDVCVKECEAFKHVFLFTSVAEVPDCMDFTACLSARRDHEKMTLELRERFKEHFGKALALSTGCMLCDDCAYPDAPCRHPEERLSTIESHGILVMETASRLGVTLDCGNDIVTYISLIFFNG
jgi:predicted metal-binding protein